MSVDPFNDPDGRGKHPGDDDPIEVMVANFEATIESRDAEIERLRAVLKDIANHDLEVGASTAARWALQDTQRREQ